MKIEVIVNGNPQTGEVTERTRLLDFLRDQAGYTSVKEGCGEGECGACTVLLEGRPVVSCMVPAVQARGKRVTTVEGLAPEGELHPVQQAFLDCDAVQCGFCTPGMVLSVYALLRETPDPTEAEIRTAIAGNLCRCTGYLPIIEAAKLAAQRRRGVTA